VLEFVITPLVCPTGDRETELIFALLIVTRPALTSMLSTVEFGENLGLSKDLPVDIDPGGGLEDDSRPVCWGSM
jgi:hypothetical protein